MLTEADRDKRVYLKLEGAASVKDVFVNGRFIGRHKGAFSASAFDLTDALNIGQANTLDVRVSNRDNERAELFFPLHALLRQWRHVPQSLAGKNRHGAYFPGHGFERRLFDTRPISPRPVADLNALTVVRNPLAAPVEVVVRHFVTDPGNKACGQFEAKQTIPAGRNSGSRPRENRPSQTLGYWAAQSLYGPH